CQQAVQLEPQNGFYIGRFSHTLLLAGQTQEALTYAQQAVEAAPSRSLSYRVLGEAYMQLGQNAEAISAFEQALELDPDNRRAIEGLASLQGTQ
ncbi:MAG: tetratricopeptide repeat protein, partial [Burkholderiales bacterium]|nr:tetratricopeptide repeat protein [Anaerolineae bacterium]